MAEKKTGIRELKARLSGYIREIKKGKTVVITERGAEVARIVPISRSMDDRIESLLGSGFADWNRKKLKSGKPVATLRPGGKTLAEIVTEDRN
jgi:prevent-host-death family protein